MSKSTDQPGSKVGGGPTSPARDDSPIAIESTERGPQRPGCVPELDALLEETARLWRIWRSTHPELAQGHPRYDADVCDGFAFTHDAIPNDRASLLRLAADDRLWGFECPVADMDTIPLMINESIEALVDDASLALDAAGGERLVVIAG